MLECLGIRKDGALGFDIVGQPIMEFVRRHGSLGGLRARSAA